MKKILLCLCCLGLSALCMAQTALTPKKKHQDTYNKFKLDVALGGALPVGGQPSQMLVLTVEPQYRFSDENEIGFRIQDAFLRQLNSSSLDGITVSPIDSYCLTADHYFSNHFFRPFVSAGFGLFRQGAVVNQAAPSQSIAEANHIGAFPRIGFEIGVLRFDVEYNYLKNYPSGVNPSYFSVNAGFFLGGGGLDRK
ncbi:hypothetical protein [uncultured Mucilaginibacter sp.]|uniref:hypothetical protein n=1 Tax=uncultured Mucilaginibacter sp. TaxID=797541 RepID=UPI0025D87093|nr:hypothetical protein [uncultured Mucilaginibacter sp.]